MFGGAIGALATAATSSQASPQAVAATVQRVQDQAAERDLNNIKEALVSINTNTYATCYATIVGARQALPSCSP